MTLWLNHLPVIQPNFFRDLRLMVPSPGALGLPIAAWGLNPTPSEKYECVNWDDEIPYRKMKNVQNRQTDWGIPIDGTPID